MNKYSLKAATLDEPLASGMGAEQAILSRVCSWERSERRLEEGETQIMASETFHSKGNGQQRSPHETQRARQDLFTPCGCPCLPTAGQGGGPEHSLKCFPNGTTEEGRRSPHWLFSECQPPGWFLPSSFSLHVGAPSGVCAFEGEHTQTVYTSVMYALQFLRTELPRALQQNQRPAHNAHTKNKK